MFVECAPKEYLSSSRNHCAVTMPDMPLSPEVITRAPALCIHAGPTGLQFTSLEFRLPWSVYLPVRNLE